MDRAWPLLLLIPIAPALWLGCGAPPCDIPDDAWWEVCADTGDLDAGDDTGEDWDDDDWDEGTFLVVELLIEGQTLEEGEVSFVHATEDGVQCDAWHQVDSAEPATGCAACESAWTLVIGETGSEGQSCEGWPLPSGSTLGVGWSGSVAYQLQDGDWRAMGDAEVWEDGGLELIFFTE